ncbi:hypothetical protein ABZS61_24900 [Streptomyces sp. NPDC005566]|uniref:hypothetical protein n=1 Tax=Streptomyces sp. NPDC005566 TaxID=3156886 RepID=UPI0033B54435
MIRHAIAPSRRFTKASHDVVRHPRLTSDAKVLLLYVQGLPDDQTEKSLSELARQLGITGRAYQKSKELLVAHGFLHEKREQGVRGLWSTAQLLSNVPLTPEEASGLRTGGDPDDEPPAPPAVRPPVVGEPVDRMVGRQPPVDEEQEKNYPHPPTEAASVPEPELEPESPEAAEGERVLLSLRHVRRELYLGVREARALAGLAATWLLRGITAAQLRQVLTSELPEGGVRSAVGFLRYRLVHKMPEEPPRAEVRAAAPPVAALVACAGPGEEHVFRSVEGERYCGECRREEARKQWEARRVWAESIPDPQPWRERFAAVTPNPNRT